MGDHPTNVAAGVLPPLLLLGIKRRSGRRDQSVLTALVKRGCGLRPPRPGLPDRGNKDLPVFGVQLDITDQASLLKEGLGDANALRIADGDNAGFD